VAYIYENIETISSDMVGTHQCVALVQHYAKVPHTSKWKEGEKVESSTKIAKGTAIATFVSGKYPNKAHGNHAAFYLSQNAAGITVVDQWVGKKGGVGARFLAFGGKDSHGNFVNASNNGDAFSIIE
jgi:hypothetical protein